MGESIWIASYPHNVFLGDESYPYLFFLSMRWKVKLANLLGNTFHCSGALALFLWKDNIWLLKDISSFWKDLPLKLPHSISLWCQNFFLSFSFLPMEKLVIQVRVTMNSNMLRAHLCFTILFHLAPCDRSYCKKINAKKHFPKRATMSSVLPFLLCNLNPTQLHKEIWGISL